MTVGCIQLGTLVSSLRDLHIHTRIQYAVCLLFKTQVWSSTAKTEVVMQLLGLGHCRDTIVGDGGLMLRGISGGERKRLTTAEMVVGPQRVLLMDEISTGLDSATLHSVITFFTSVRGRRVQRRLHAHVRWGGSHAAENATTLNLLMPLPLPEPYH